MSRVGRSLESTGSITGVFTGYSVTSRHVTPTEFEYGSGSFNESESLAVLQAI